jgi:hypothetical protein
MVALRNWSDSNHIIEVQFHEDFDQFISSVCVKLQTHPIHLYFLGDEKAKENRLKLPNQITLAECLTHISQWKASSTRPMPELLFEIHQSPTGSPDNMEKRRAASRDQDARSAGRSSTGSRSSKFSPIIMRRDGRTCVFCGAVSVE